MWYDAAMVPAGKPMTVQEMGWWDFPSASVTRVTDHANTNSP